jgi:hypothetical protein
MASTYLPLWVLVSCLHWVGVAHVEENASPWEINLSCSIYNTGASS